jgi:hypothetical protein
MGSWQPKHRGTHPPMFGRLLESGEPAAKSPATYPYELDMAIAWSVLKAKPHPPQAPHQPRPAPGVPRDPPFS